MKFYINTYYMSILAIYLSNVQLLVSIKLPMWLSAKGTVKVYSEYEYIPSLKLSTHFPLHSIGTVFIMLINIKW